MALQIYIKFLNLDTSYNNIISKCLLREMEHHTIKSQKKEPNLKNFAK